MRTDLRVVSPYRPFAPESQAHKMLGPFDWVGALRMLATSVARSNQCETLAITDVDTTLPIPTLQFVTTERRLMLWILEVSLRYLESSSFDRDTIMMCPDTLVFGDLSGYFTDVDLGIIVRPGEKYVKRPILNSVQFWAVQAQDRLVAFYREALAIAKTLDKHTLRWGADTVPLVQLLTPIVAGIVTRDGLTVRMIPTGGVFDTFSNLAIKRLEQGQAPLTPLTPIVDFKYFKKRHMAAYFDSTFGKAVGV